MIDQAGPQTERIERTTRFVHEGKYAASVPVDMIVDETGWSPHLTFEDATKLDDVRRALRRGDVAEAAKFGSVFKLVPIPESSQMPASPPRFAARGDHDAIELGVDFAPKFDGDGLIVAIAADAATGEVLMVAHMNEEALARTIETGSAWFWSRSRKKLWRKGEDSGNTLAVREMRVDCDQDAILLRVEIAGDAVACHQGYRSCFYRTVPVGAAPTPALRLGFDGAMPRAPRNKE